MIANKDPYTWQELKQFCNSLSEEQLANEVIWFGEERGGKVGSAECFAEDQINPSGDGIEPVSNYKDDTDIDITTEKVIFKAGFPGIFVDFK